MSSAAHQWLLLWAARKMAADGYRLGGYEGPTPQGGRWNALPVPFEIVGVRPDAWGVSRDGGRVAVGEAKTSRDINTAHTRRQLEAFGGLRHRTDGAPCPLYVAVPHAARTRMRRVLADLGLAGAPHVTLIGVPECLLTEVQR